MRKSRASKDTEAKRGGFQEEGIGHSIKCKEQRDSGEQSSFRDCW